MAGPVIGWTVRALQRPVFLPSGSLTAYGVTDAEMLTPLDNYISRGKEAFLSNPDYLKMVLAMYQKVLFLTSRNHFKTCIDSFVFLACRG